MSTVNAAVRLRALLLGIRPSLAHTRGLSSGFPADNFTETGVEAWRTGLFLVGKDFDIAAQAGALGPRDRWIRDWIRVELDRDATRWSDAASMLRILALVLGPGRHEIPAGRAFWSQWHRNLAHLAELLSANATLCGQGTSELADHCRDVAIDHGAPAAVLSLLADVASQPEHAGSSAAFSPLATEVDRIYLADIVAASFASGDACRAALDRFYNPGVHQAPVSCTANPKRPLEGAGPRFRAGSSR